MPTKFMDKRSLGFFNGRNSMKHNKFLKTPLFLYIKCEGPSTMGKGSDELKAT